MTKPDNIIMPWRAKSGKSAKWLAQQVGISYDNLSRYACGNRPIPRPVALAIQAVTEGGVKLSDWGLE